MNKPFAAIILLSLSACNSTTTTSSAPIDPNASSQLFSDLSSQTELAAANLPNSNSASYSGYIEVNLSASATAIGELNANVNFGSDTYTMSSTNWIEVTATTEASITGSLTGSGTVVTDPIEDTAGITGTLAGQVDGTDVDLVLSGTFTGSGSGMPTGLFGGSDSGTTHSARFALE
jgi:hypothetical protein